MMNSLDAQVCWRLTLLLCALLVLSACGNAPQVVYRDRAVEVPVPVVQPLDPRLTADCPARTDVPQTGPLTVRQALDRLAAVEDALATCRNQVAVMREAR